MSWRCRAGDVGVTLSASREWAHVQRRHLGEYLPRPAGGHSIAEFTLDVHTEGELLHQMTNTASPGPTVAIEIIPGLTLRHVHQAAGWQCFTVASDALEGQPGAWAVRARGTEFELFLREESARAHRYPLRLIREVMLRSHENHGGVVFHAGAVDLHGTGMLVCGPRAAGKTTTLACLLRAGGVLLSNDRIILHSSQRLVAVPLPVPIARGTLDAFPELADSVGPTASAALPASFGTPHKVALSARQFATALGTTMTPTAQLRLIIAPQLTDTHEPAWVERLDTQQARDVLSRCCSPRTTNSGSDPGSWHGPTPTPPSRSVPPTCWTILQSRYRALSCAAVCETPRECCRQPFSTPRATRHDCPRTVCPSGCHRAGLPRRDHRGWPRLAFPPVQHRRAQGDAPAGRAARSGPRHR